MSGKQGDVPPPGPPPSYDHATSSLGTPSSKNDTSSRLQVPGSSSRSKVPIDRRRSMEDEVRPLPEGWVRQWDSQDKHQFFVDTRANPPRSTWCHPYDDDQFLRSLSTEEREALQESERLPSHKTDFSEEEYDGELPPRPQKGRSKSSAGSSIGDKKEGLGSKFKSKLTGTTKEEREQKRAEQTEQERRQYEAHQKFRQAMDQAMRTGEPVFLGKDKDGKDVYVEPPGGPRGPQMYGQQGGGQGGYGINPYSNGVYSDPNARFVRPQMPYSRPYGYGYGGYGGGYGGYGYGRPGMGMGMPMMGGMMGGMMLGGLLF